MSFSQFPPNEKGPFSFQKKVLISATKIVFTLRNLYRCDFCMMDSCTRKMNFPQLHLPCVRYIRLFPLGSPCRQSLFLFIIFIIHNLFLVVNLWYFFNLFITFQIKRNTLLHLINQHFFFYFCNFCISSIGIQLDFFIWCMICKHILNNFYLRFFFSSLKNTIQ